jgi:hypothetical protein
VAAKVTEWNTLAKLLMMWPWSSSIIKSTIPESLQVDGALCHNNFTCLTNPSPQVLRQIGRCKGNHKGEKC